MPWLRAGSVAVTNGSSTVTGTNADFAANARNGDSFIGPDGRNYEVSNVASATVLSILPAYQGATASGAAYSIMPVQGYDKLLSDAFNNLNNQFGPKLAALGTTGNYDILPASKGGTGRGAVGTAITADLTTTVTDGTVGRVLKVGDLGLGAALAAAAYELANLDATTITPGEWRIGSTTTGTKPFNFGIVKISQQATSVILQSATEFGSGVRADRAYISGGWTPWLFTMTATTYNGILSLAKGGTGNATGTASALVASKILGAVSQSAGVPTGAILEYVTNGNGEAYKFANGLMIATRFIADQPFNVPTGTIGYRNDIAMPAVFPAGTTVRRTYAGFVSDANGNRLSLPINDDTAPTGNNGVWACSVNNPASALPVTRILGLQLTAIGRWF